MRETEHFLPIDHQTARHLQLIVANLHWRYSGVTATSRMVSPKLAKMFSAAWLGPAAPEGIARMGPADLLKLWRRRTPLIWHARRNNEMIVGVLLRSLRWPLKLVFTSAAQRHHTWITRWLINRMDAIIATNDISASFLKREATVIPHGVDTDTYAPPANRAAAFAEAGLPGRYAIGAWTRCADCCRAILISPPSWSARSRPSALPLRTICDSGSRPPACNRASSYQANFRSRECSAGR